MSLLSDHQIIKLAQQGMIDPYVLESIVEVGDVLGAMRKVLSYGPSSYGYDARLAPHFKLLTPAPGVIMDVKNPDPRLFTVYEADEFVIPPHSYVLCHSIETFHIPNNVLSLCVGKSSYARCGLIVNVTPLEPGWIGEVTLEISNPTPIPCRVYANEGICQFIFIRGETACEATYATKAKGKPSKYQNQVGVVIAR